MSSTEDIIKIKFTEMFLDSTFLVQNCNALTNLKSLIQNYCTTHIMAV